jgi:hypothetical protein
MTSFKKKNFSTLRKAIFHTYGYKTPIKKEPLKIQKNAGATQEAKYIESWPNTTSAWVGWRRFDIPVDNSCEV